jgi:hypothetical protein
MGKTLLLATTAGLVSAEDIPFWGCGMLGPIPGINAAGVATGDTARLIEGLKNSNPYKKVSYWNWNLAPMNPADADREYLSEDFLFMPEQWGVEEVNDEWVREANAVGFLDSDGDFCPAQMADIFLGANEPDIRGSCMGTMMGACTAPCTPAEAAGDCPTAHLNGDQGTASPNANGHCDCWSDSHATGCGFWPVNGVDAPQPLPTCWDDPQCASVQISEWKKTAATAAAKGYKYMSSPLVAVDLDYIDEFLSRACSESTDVASGCPSHIGWHFYANDCLSGGDSGYDGFQDKLDKTVQIMEKYPHLMGAIVNEVGMLNCAMDTPDAICIPNGPDQHYPALSQPDHACPSTPTLPDGLATFVEELLRRVSLAKTSDGRRAITSFTWFNQDMAGGTYNLQIFNGDGSLNKVGERYITACQAWADGGPMPSPVPHPTPSPVPVPTPPQPGPAPGPAPAPTPTPSGSCGVGDAVSCDGSTSSNEMCAGNQCCPDGSTCPSADPTFTGCAVAKKFDCTHSSVVV